MKPCFHPTCSQLKYYASLPSFRFPITTTVAAAHTQQPMGVFSAKQTTTLSTMVRRESLSQPVLGPAVVRMVRLRTSVFQHAAQRRMSDVKPTDSRAAPTDTHHPQTSNSSSNPASRPQIPSTGYLTCSREPTTLDPVLLHRTTHVAGSRPLCLGRHAHTPHTHTHARTLTSTPTPICR